MQAADLDTREVFPKIAAALAANSGGRSGFRNWRVPKIPARCCRRRAAAPDREPADGWRHDLSGCRRLVHDRKPRHQAAGREADHAKRAFDPLEGRVETRDSGPAGTFAFDLTGATPEAMHDLVSKAGLVAVLGEERFKGLKDGKIAGLIRLGLQVAAATDVTFDGTLNGAHLNGTAEFDGGLAGWRSRPSRMQTALDAPSLSSLLKTLGRAPVSDGQAAQPARASIVTAGIIGSDANVRADVSSPDFNVSFNGHSQWPDNANLALGGTLDFKASQFTDALAAAGVSLPSGAENVAARGSLEIGRTGPDWTIATTGFSVGTSTLAGNVTVKPDADAMRIDGKLETDRVAFQSLLAAVTDARTGAACFGRS